MVLFATLAKDSETMLQELSVARLEVILKMNMTETHIMCNSTKCRVEVAQKSKLKFANMLCQKNGQH